MKPRLLVAAVVVLAALAAILLARPGGDDALAALRADPLASWHPGLLAGWRELGKTADEARGARPASVRSGFVVGRDGDAFYDEALAAAKGAGWMVHDLERGALSPPVQRTATARKTGPGGRELRGIIVLTESTDHAASTDELTVELTAPNPGG